MRLTTTHIRLDQIRLKWHLSWADFTDVVLPKGTFKDSEGELMSHCQKDMWHHLDRVEYVYAFGCYGLLNSMQIGEDKPNTFLCAPLTDGMDFMI